TAPATRPGAFSRCPAPQEVPMKKSPGIAVVAALLGLAFAQSAFAAVSPKLTVTASPGSHQVTIAARDPNPSDDALARLQIYVPAGFALNAPAGGAVVGKATGFALVKDVDP